jgi:mono/diheme cytochrome c family protein
MILASLAFGLTLSACKSCVDQHNPRPDEARFKEEAARGNATVEKLNPDGTVPAPAAPAVAVAAGTKNPGVEKYEQFCAACHGIDGKADGAAAQAMNPKPRNLTDAKWQASVDDAHITKVIKEGGASVGLSATMAPWGAVVNDEEIKQMVEHIRAIKQ